MRAVRQGRAVVFRAVTRTLVVRTRVVRTLVVRTVHLLRPLAVCTAWMHSMNALLTSRRNIPRALSPSSPAFTLMMRHIPPAVQDRGDGGSLMRWSSIFATQTTREGGGGHPPDDATDPDHAGADEVRRAGDLGDTC